MPSPENFLASDSAREEGHVDDAGATDSATGEGSYQSLDPLDPRKVSLDVFELYCHEMMLTVSVGRRAFLVQKMRYMINRLIGKQYDYGRLYNRTCISNIVSRVCGRHAYDVADADEIEEGGQSGKSYRLVGFLVDFTPDRWKTVIIQFQFLRESMLRNDAALMVLPSELDDKKDRSSDEVDEDVPEGDGGVNEALERSSEFSTHYMKILQLMKFHTCLSHLQPQLEEALRKGSEEGAESVVIPHDDIVAFCSEIEEQFGDNEDKKYAGILNLLLEVNIKINRPTRCGGVRLKSLNEIKAIITKHSREFDLAHFQRRFLQLIRRWADLVLPVPELVKLHYGSTNADNEDAQKSMATGSDEERQYKRQKCQDNRKSPPAAIATTFENQADDGIDSSEEETDGKMGAREDLEHKRKALMRNVKDPFSECIEISKCARPRQKGKEPESKDNQNALKSPSFRKEKKSTRKLCFTDSESSEGEDATLSELPARYEPKAQSPPAIRVSRKFPTKKRRQRFTEVEDSAIRKGVEECGAGNWATIKASYHVELRDRTTVQIKDRWRTLNK